MDHGETVPLAGGVDLLSRDGDTAVGREAS
jgi:hypothetical protein